MSALNSNNNNSSGTKKIHFSENSNEKLTKTNAEKLPRDSGCYIDDNNMISVKNNHGKNISTKAIAKKANLLNKKRNHIGDLSCSSKTNSRRVHSKSCSAANYDDIFCNDENTLEESIVFDDEHDKTVSSLQNSLNINNAKLAGCHKKKNNKKPFVKLSWGKPGDDISAETLDIDSNDPNYDSENEKIDDISFKMVSMSLSESDFDRLVNAWLDEYFDHGDCNEVCNLLIESSPTLALLARFPFLAISAGLEKRPAQREMISQLLSAVCDSRPSSKLGGHLVNHDLMAQGFELLLFKELADLTVDLPDAPELVGCFIARAVADDLIAPKFIDQMKTHQGSEFSDRAIHKAENLLHIPHAYAKLDSVWLGPTGLLSSLNVTAKPTRQLSKAFNNLIKEYLNANDLKEVETTIRELDSPHFLHEFVFLALQLMSEKGTESAAIAVTNMIKYLFSSGQLSLDMINNGIRRLYAQLSDFALDVPTVHLSLHRFLKLGKESGFIGENIIREMPKKKRSRFISECAPKSNDPIDSDEE